MNKQFKYLLKKPKGGSMDYWFISDKGKRKLISSKYQEVWLLIREHNIFPLFGRNTKGSVLKIFGIFEYEFGGRFLVNEYKRRELFEAEYICWDDKKPYNKWRYKMEEYRYLTYKEIIKVPTIYPNPYIKKFVGFSHRFPLKFFRRK
jgi:hypothetical protein